MVGSSSLDRSTARRAEAAGRTAHDAMSLAKLNVRRSKRVSQAALAKLISYEQQLSGRSVSRTLVMVVRASLGVMLMK